MSIGASGTPPEGPKVTLDGVPLSGFVASIQAGQLFVALGSLPRLHATVAFDRARGLAAMGVGRRTVLLAAGSPVATVDGQPAAMNLSPLIDKGEFWVPVECLRLLGLRVTWNAPANLLALAWARPCLLSVSLDKTGTVPRLVLEASAEIKATVFSLTGPDRLVVDLSGLTPYDYLGLDDRENEYFRQLRAAMNRPGVLRLVADLHQAVGYRIDSSQAKEGRLCIELNTLIYGIAVVPADEGKKLVVKANHRLEWSAMALADPDRIVIDVNKATLAIPPGFGPGDNDWLGGVEYRTPGPNRVQVVANLTRPQSCSIATAYGRDDIIEVQPVYILSRLTWSEKADGFSFFSNGAIAVSSTVQHYPERLVLTVLHANTVADEGDLGLGPVGHYRVKQIQPGKVEIALDLRYDVPFALEFSGDRRHVTVSFQPSPLAGKTIVLDAGHGGEDAGAIGRTLGLREKAINLDVAMRLKEMLEGAGAIVHLTRVDDTYVPLFARASFANRLPAEIFVSIHTNAHDDPAVNGVEIFYYPGKDVDRRLACLALEDIVAALGLLPRGAKANDFAVLRECQVPSILIELGFLSNGPEEARLATEEFHRRSALAISRAITRFARGEAAAAALPGPGLAN